MNAYPGDVSGYAYPDLKDMGEGRRVPRYDKLQPL